MPPPGPQVIHPTRPLRAARVLRVQEQECEIWDDGVPTIVPFGAAFPSPRVERVSPGHLVAVATGPDGADRIVWRWYDAVVLGQVGDGSVRLWEPAHGEVVARARASYRPQVPGSRAFASAGLPGADWWVAAPADGLQDAEVELADVDALYATNRMWSSVFDSV